MDTDVMKTPPWVEHSPVHSEREPLNVARWTSYLLKAPVAVPLLLCLVLLDCLDAMRSRGDQDAESPAAVAAERGAESARFAAEQGQPTG